MLDFSWISQPGAWLGLLTLSLLEIVLGIDNIVFISILASKLPPEQQSKARRLGLLAALVTRVLLISLIFVIAHLEKPLFHVLGQGISGRDLVLMAGGLFLIFKATREIHDKLEGQEHAPDTKKDTARLHAVVLQIGLLDIVFSLDSVITAVGMVEQITVMILAVFIAVGFMLVFVNPVSRFVERHPTVKMLALAFLILIGVNLVAEATEIHIPKGYTYFAMAFSVFVEVLNLRLRSTKVPVSLRRTTQGR